MTKQKAFVQFYNWTLRQILQLLFQQHTEFSSEVINFPSHLENPNLKSILLIATNQRGNCYFKAMLKMLSLPAFLLLYWKYQVSI